MANRRRGRRDDIWNKPCVFTVLPRGGLLPASRMRPWRTAQRAFHRVHPLPAPVRLGGRECEGAASAVNFGRHRHHRLLRSRQPQSSGASRPGTVSQPRTGCAGAAAGGRADRDDRRSDLRQPVPVTSGRILRGSRWRSFSRRLFQPEPGRLDAWRPGRVCPAGRRDPARPLRWRSQHPRHPRRSGGNLSHLA
jgi:hypothetical protein